MMRRLLSATILLLLLCPVICAQTKQKVRRYDDTSRPVIGAKGDWMVGGTASFTGHSNDGFSLAVVEGINSVGFHVSAAPEFCRFVEDNLGLGVKLSYGRSMFDLANASAGFGTVSLNVKDYITISQDASLTVFFRYIIPIGDSDRFAMYADAGFRAAMGHGKDTDEHTGYVVGTWRKSWNGGLVVNPGLLAFVTDRMSIFASIGMAAFTVGRTGQVHNQVEEGMRKTSNFSYMLDLTSVGVGIDFYIGKK